MHKSLIIFVISLVILTSCQNSGTNNVTLNKAPINVFDTYIAGKSKPNINLKTSNQLLINGDFETGVAPWESCNDNESIKISSDAYTGKQALVLLESKNCFYQSIDLVGSGITTDKLYLSCFAKKKSTAGWAGMGIAFSNSNWDVLKAASEIEITATTYFQYAISSFVPKETKYASMWAYSDNQLLVDNCELKTVSVPPPPPPPITPPPPPLPPTPLPTDSKQTCKVKNNSDWGSALYLPGLTEPDQEPDYVVASEGLSLNLDYSEGTAKLEGYVEHFTNPKRRWQVNIMFSGQTSTAPSGNDTAPTGKVWYYYPNKKGMLVGKEVYQGITLSIISSKGTALQVGAGANTVHLEIGARAELYYNQLINGQIQSINKMSEWVVKLECQ